MCRWAIIFRNAWDYEATFVALLRSIVVWIVVHVGIVAVSPAPPHYDGTTAIGGFTFALFGHAAAHSP
ncbi:hypothetical protein CJU94_37930 (plasmid) [Paraburkholderia aromaticivorans]|uniref:Uncharacterized protein n=1 Tax=Paraburkholderia aromaticivorans TaxID=2026199 RepID=A0A248VY49_9BURK|nr:hypothetical protein CJU94_37930 [Paraburkholderia aromaticivorans]